MSGMMLMGCGSGSSASLLPIWEAALAAADSQTVWLECIGDSTTLGGQGETGDVWTNSYPAVLRAGLASGVTVDGPGLVRLAATGADPALTWGQAEHLTYTGTWSGMAGTLGFNAAEAGDQITFQTVYAARYVTVWRNRIYDAGQFSYRIDAGEWVAVTPQTGSIVVASTVIDCGTNDAHTVDVRYDSGYICLYGFSSAGAGVGLQVYNAGQSGASASSVRDPLLSVKGTLVAPSLTIIMIGANDWNAQNSLAAYKSKLEDRVAAALLGGGDVMLMSPIPPNASKTITIAEYAQQMEDVATANGLVYVDTVARWATYSPETLATYYEDVVHGSPAGYAEIAAAVLAEIGA